MRMGGRTPTHLPHRLAMATLLSLALLAALGAGVARAESRIVVREGARRLVAIAPDGGATQTLVRLHRGAILATTAAPDGRLVAFASRTFRKVGGEKEWTDRLWTLRPGGRPHLIKTVVSSGVGRGTAALDALAISPDGRLLAVQRRAGAVFLLRVDGSGFRPVEPAGYDFRVGDGRNSTRPEFAPGGHRLLGIFYPPEAAVTDIGGIGTVSVDGGPVGFLRRGPFTAGIGNFTAPTYAPDGRRIAFVAGGRRSGPTLAIMRRDGSAAHRIAPTLLPGWSIENPTFSPSGRSLAFVGKDHGKGNTIIGRTPSALFTIGVDGHRLRTVQTEKAHLFGRDPVWVRWPRRR